jgi:hypothetical protein
VRTRAFLEYLHERLGRPPEGRPVLEHLVTHPSHEILAKHIVYVEARSPAEVAEEVLRTVTLVSGPRGS